MITTTTPEHIAKNVNQITFTDFAVPALDEFFVHFLDRPEWAVIMRDNIVVAVMPVGDEKRIWHVENTSFLGLLQ